MVVVLAEDYMVVVVVAAAGAGSRANTVVFTHFHSYTKTGSYYGHFLPAASTN